MYAIIGGNSKIKVSRLRDTSRPSSLRTTRGATTNSKSLKPLKSDRDKNIDTAEYPVCLIRSEFLVFLADSLGQTMCYQVKMFYKIHQFS